MDDASVRLASTLRLVYISGSPGRCARRGTPEARSTNESPTHNQIDETNEHAARVIRRYCSAAVKVGCSRSNTRAVGSGRQRAPQAETFLFLWGGQRFRKVEEVRFR
eukprot:2120937-Prymnesium_polylepis.2